MTVLRSMREGLKGFYGNAAFLLNVILKFVLAVATYGVLRHFLGGEGFFSNNFLILVLGCLSAVLPVTAIPIFAGILAVGLAWSIGLEAVAITAMVLLVLTALFLRFAPQSAILIVLVPMSMTLGFPCLVPVLAALKSRLSSIMGIGCGVVVYYLLKTLTELANGTMAVGNDLTARVQGIATGVFGRDEMALHLVVLCGVFVVVFMLRQLSMPHSRTIAAVGGPIVYVLLMIAGASLANGAASPAGLVPDVIVTILAALVLNFFLFDVDYRRTEYLEFEDDTYYYYVKAIPKVSVKTPKNGEAEEEALMNKIAENAGIDRMEI
ncbi:MAG: hypothetical protein Q4B73_02270 [Lachnospiraceae bacterium]|nr:hypothetical protein [Lachnospiraceae bacterium]